MGRESTPRSPRDIPPPPFCQWLCCGWGSHSYHVSISPAVWAFKKFYRRCSLWAPFFFRMKYCVCADLVCICKKVDSGSLYYTTFPESSITIALNSFSSRFFSPLLCHFEHIPLSPHFIWLAVLGYLYSNGSLYQSWRAGFCRRFHYVDCVCLVVLENWRLSKCEIGFIWCWGLQSMVPEAWLWSPIGGVLGYTPVNSVLLGERW